jgi:drug/metabolite transporter (DMT)-like permease
MPRRDTLISYGLFAIVCGVWGSTWIATKNGVTAVPPLLFVGSRFVGAGIVLLPLAWIAARRGWPEPMPASAALTTWQTAARVAPGALLMMSVNYGLLGWGMTRVSSGIAAIVNCAAIPLATAFAQHVRGAGRLSRLQWLAMAAGPVGLSLLLWPHGGAASGPAGAAGGPSGVQVPGGFSDGLPTGELIGGLAIAVGACCYAWGSIGQRRLVQSIPPLTVCAWQCAIGGVALFAVGWLAEPLDAGTVAAFLAPSRFAGWLYLVLIGSGLGLSAYFTLLRRWDASRVAGYAYICPFLAVALGAWLAGETLSAREIAGALVLLLSAYVIIRPPKRLQVPVTAPIPATAPLREM